MQPLNVSDCENGCRLEVKAKPGARKEGISGVYDCALKIGINSAPEKGKANQALCKFLGKLLGVPASKVEILSGQTSQQKTFFIPLKSGEVLDIIRRKEPDL